ncbi:isomerase [Streptomyces bambusae]|uniref:5-carboxymethyl-2-hydroxymuconate Delta-isomerase n=1 Tax=Streptomyces bambusae TaxID=1550616 RepID=UPI001CFCD875|nr:isomerase [Streptomyces bambusae]MCB5168426.1 isomerase [Streptomyces bambusae]
MPHITVDHSSSLYDVLDRRGLGLALHTLTADLVNAPVAACKTRFRTADETFVADGSPEHAVVHVEIALLAGRTQETKDKLSEAVLDLLRTHTTGATGQTVHHSVDVTELTPAYRQDTTAH